MSNPESSDHLLASISETTKIEVLFSEIEIRARIKDMAHDIVKEIGKDILLVGILRGSFIFVADLMRALHHSGAHTRIAFMSLSSYGDGTISQGVRVVHDLDQNVENENVLIIEDIIESGRTVKFAKDLIAERGAKTVQIAALLHKSGFEKVEVTGDFIGFNCPPEFVIGYGLDWANRFRELPYVGVIKPN